MRLCVYIYMHTYIFILLINLLLIYSLYIEYLLSFKYCNQDPCIVYAHIMCAYVYLCLWKGEGAYYNSKQVTVLALKKLTVSLFLWVRNSDRAHPMGEISFVVSHWLVGRCWLELQSSEGWIGS
jgi:hypothetical protein